MAIRINNIKASLDETNEEIKQKALRKISYKNGDCIDFKIVRRSLDARKKQLSFVYSVELNLKDEKNVLADGTNIIKFEERKSPKLIFGKNKFTSRPVIIGSGPCGLFCALTLAKHGYSPLILERGEDIDKRTKSVDSFFKTATLNTSSNIQFGEGGAGTFSDGKLTTRINDVRSFSVLKTFHEFGADSSILINAKPHIGTDVLKTVIKNMRKEIIRLGGEFRFSTLADDFVIKDKKLTHIITDSGEEIPSNCVVLAIGHSARDTYEKLFSYGIDMEQKAFSVGARVEHKQSYIDKALYGDFAGHPALSAADYSLSYRKDDIGCYSFCMCPGGTVVAACSEEESVVTNGMSEFARNGENANSAVCVSVTSKNFESKHPLAGINFQRKLEKNAYIAGGKAYTAPVQLVSDFIDGKKSTAISNVLPTYPIGTHFYDLNRLFPNDISKMLADGLRFFDTKIKGFTKNGAILTAAETRTSAPLRILRNDLGESTNISGLYPSGEGAGYAGGIMSAAVDGIKTAEKIISRFAPPDFA